MKISIVSTHSFPIGLHGPVTKTGDVVIMDLVIALSQMGHEVNFFTPGGGYVPRYSSIEIYPMKCSFGKYPPSSQDCETDSFNKYYEVLCDSDIVHDFSNSKCIINNLYLNGYKNVISTLMGGAWVQPEQPHNLIVWSQSHRDRVLRGATDYEGSPTPGLAGGPGIPVTEAKVVHGGIDIGFYTPTYEKKNFFLWLNRWHDAKGYKQAIELAKQTGIELVMSGEHPDNEMFEHQRNCALEAIELAKGYSNIKFEWLPKECLAHHTAKKELYRQAKALIYSVNFNEPFGLSQTQALACGTPVIAVNYGSPPEIIKDGVTGFIRNNTVSDFYQAITLIDNINPEVCRQTAVEKYDRSVMAKNYLDKYNEIISGKNWS